MIEDIGNSLEIARTCTQLACTTHTHCGGHVMWAHGSYSTSLSRMEGSNITSVLWEADAEVNLGHFFLEEIFLVEKENNGSGREILVIADAVE